ncbi:MAG TPA: AMP-binding protein, partial [Pyrinomonadaceae bacterium]|nr:AMP-binding protein [Pyrinomonadaceae bacterium]
MSSAASAKIEAQEIPAPATSSVPALCLTATLRHGKADALNHRGDGEWIKTSATTFAERVRHVALGLALRGIRRGDRVALLSENRPEWSIVDLAILSLGAINVPIYTTQAVDQVRYILTDSGARVLFISNRRLYRHAQKALGRLGFLEKLIFFDADGTEAIEHSMSLASLEEAGKEQHRERPAAFAEYLSAVQPQDLATIIYTSGTTGEPKGVMLTHNNFISNVLSITGALPISSTDTALSVLPLSHIFERTGFYIFCYSGVSVYYAASFDQVGENLKEVRPTVMTAVPRLFEKVYHRIVKKGM